MQARERSLSSLAAHRGTEDQAARAAVAKIFDNTRKRLVDTGTRNRLVHVNQESTRGNVLNIVNERAGSVYAFLSSEKAMRFLAIGTDKTEDAGGIVFADSGGEGFDLGRYDDAQLETRLGPTRSKRSCSRSRARRRPRKKSRASTFSIFRWAT